MKIGDRDVSNSIINLEHDVFLMQQLLNYILSNNSGIKFPSKIELDKFENQTISMLQSKYPNMGIQKK